MQYRYAGDVYNTGQHYIELSDGVHNTHVHINLLISKSEHPRFRAMVQGMYGNNVDAEGLREEIQDYIFKTHQKHQVSSIAVARLNAVSNGYDGLALAEYIMQYMKKTVGVDYLELTREEQVKKYGFISLSTNNIQFDKELEESTDLHWIRSTVLTKILGLTEDHKKGQLVNELGEIGLVITRESTETCRRLSVGNMTLLGHMINVNYKESERYRHYMCRAKERHERQLEQNVMPLKQAMHRIHTAEGVSTFERVKETVH